MREAYVRSGNPREAIVTGFGQSGRVVTAAKSIGLSLAFGVLADAFLVRLTLVPAVMTLLGRSAWKLPRRLERAMPDVDIEGEKLLETLHPART